MRVPLPTPETHNEGLGNPMTNKARAGVGGSKADSTGLLKARGPMATGAQMG